MVWALLMAASFVAAIEFGQGTNVLQKLGSLVWMFPVSTAVAFVLARILCRGELWDEARRVLRIFGRE